MKRDGDPSWSHLDSFAGFRRLLVFIYPCDVFNCNLFCVFAGFIWAFARTVGAASRAEYRAMATTQTRQIGRATSELIDELCTKRTASWPHISTWSPKNWRAPEFYCSSISIDGGSKQSRIRTFRSCERKSSNTSPLSLRPRRSLLST